MIDWNKIENFIGYGNPDAEVLFLGMEEGLGQSADLGGDLAERSRYSQCMDLFDAQGPLDDGQRFFGPNPKSQRTWRPMCHLMLRMLAPSSRPTAEQRVRYQADLLGRSGGATLLAELMPYPNTNVGEWRYAPFGRYPTREAYAVEMLPRRVDLLGTFFRAHNYKLIVAYGKSYWPDFQRIFVGVSWEDRGIFRVGRFGSTAVVLTPHFATRSFNTEAQIDAFADIALGVP